VDAGAASCLYSSALGPAPLKRGVMLATRIEPLVACAVLILLAGCATQSRLGETEVLPARVFRVIGDARWKSAADQPWQTVKTGTRLDPGAEIQTAAKSRANISAPYRTRKVLG